VKGADEVLVTLTDKRELKAKVVGLDERTDVAVVKVEATGLPAIRVGSSEKVKVGEWVMAIGSPFGLDNSVTAGIVSARQRETGELLPFIQSDVAINPGNSGGPLINLRGEVIGVNSQILSRTGGSVGVSFSIPIDEALRVSEQLRASGRVQRGRIGVELGEVDKDLAESLGLGAKAQGAAVVRVLPDTPAAKAGLEPGDIITKVDGKTIERRVELQRTIAAMKPGTATTLTLLRKGQSREVKLSVGEAPDDNATARSPGGGAKPEAPKATPSESMKAIGLTVVELTDKERTDAKLKGGVKVAASEGIAARAGLREGDVILAAANTEVSTVAQLEAIVAKADKTKPYNLLVRSGEATRYVLIRPSAAPK
jgi:serine protease Do